MILSLNYDPISSMFPQRVTSTLPVPNLSTLEQIFALPHPRIEKTSLPHLPPPLSQMLSSSSELLESVGIVVSFLNSYAKASHCNVRVTMSPVMAQLLEWRCSRLSATTLRTLHAFAIAASNSRRRSLRASS
uniref:Uncharacterized protein n=1 Tax=Opuntia streptacantha TaxID=393608 RepID=A0A7C9AF92_OPUST